MYHRRYKVDRYHAGNTIHFYPALPFFTPALRLGYPYLNKPLRLLRESSTLLSLSTHTRLKKPRNLLRTFNIYPQHMKRAMMTTAARASKVVLVVASHCSPGLKVQFVSLSSPPSNLDRVLSRGQDRKDLHPLVTLKPSR